MVYRYTTLYAIPYNGKFIVGRTPRGFPEGAVKGTIHLGEDDDRQFVGVKREEDLWSAGHAAWGEGPNEVIGIIHPDPNVNPAIVRWMNQNDVGWAITRYRDGETGMINYWITRANGWNTSKDGTYSTLFYDGAR
ncbi:hypothetical protein AGMMS49579_13260 [Spirochaetia bacterium]|nr:hypothetical protein AGMMS49579_13260 [Spirochaetia bacterium]